MASQRLLLRPSGPPDGLSDAERPPEKTGHLAVAGLFFWSERPVR